MLGAFAFTLIIAPDVSKMLGGYTLHVLIFPQIVKCKVLTSSTAGVKFIADTFHCRAPDMKLSPQFTTLLARQCSYTRSAETIFVPMDASSPQLLVWQRSYTRSSETIFIPMDALSPQFTTLLARQCSYTRSAEIISVPTDALHILTDMSGTMPSFNKLRSLANSTHRPMFATRSGAAPHIGIYSPSVGNMLRDCALHWNLLARRWQHAWGLRLTLALLHSPDVGNMLGGCASH
jgi:hypothetical protein